MTQAAPGVPDTRPDDEIAALRDRIDDLDQEILRLLGDRIALAREAVAIRLRSGGPRVVHQRELSVLRTYRKLLGDGGGDLGLLVLRLSRDC